MPEGQTRVGEETYVVHQLRGRQREVVEEGGEDRARERPPFAVHEGRREE